MSKKLFTGYLQGDAQQARKSLQDEIGLFENSKAVSFRRQAAALFVECCRLYVLEKRTGNDVASELVLVKARYWNLRRYELSEGLTASALEEFRSCTPDRMVEMIDHADKTFTAGAGPRYVRDLQTSRK